MLSLVAPDSPPPYVASPANNSLRRSRQSRSRSNIQIEDGFTRRLWLSGVVVDDISHLGLLSVDFARDEPVMAIERRLRSVTSC